MLGKMFIEYTYLLDLVSHVRRREIGAVFASHLARAARLELVGASGPSQPSIDFCESGVAYSASEVVLLVKVTLKHPSCYK